MLFGPVSPRRAAELTLAWPDDTLSDDTALASVEFEPTSTPAGLYICSLCKLYAPPPKIHEVAAQQPKFLCDCGLRLRYGKA